MLPLTIVIVNVLDPATSVPDGIAYSIVHKVRLLALMTLRNVLTIHLVKPPPSSTSYRTRVDLGRSSRRRRGPGVYFDGGTTASKRGCGANAQCTRPNLGGGRGPFDSCGVVYGNEPVCQICLNIVCQPGA